MKLPFVSREALDLACAEAAYFRVKCEQWEARYLELAVPKPVVAPEKVVDPVAQAIRAAAGGSSALRTHLAHFARTEREKGTDEKDIVEQIRAYEQGPARVSNRAERDEANAALADVLDAE